MQISPQKPLMTQMMVKKKQGKKKKSCGEQNKTRKISKSNVQTRIYLRNIGSARMKNINDLH
jgi:hypothetical protein